MFPDREEVTMIATVSAPGNLVRNNGKAHEPGGLMKRRIPVADLVQEHRTIETALDRLGESLASGQLDGGCFRHAAQGIARHYLREEEFIARLRQHEPAFAAKLAAQHEEASEIAARLQESLAAGQSADVSYLARRFLAIAQHNMIEEERDAFPLAERCFGTEEEP
jgi:hemerythrin-like domain-containing protein